MDCLDGRERLVFRNFEITEETEATEKRTGASSLWRALSWFTAPGIAGFSAKSQVKVAHRIAES
jgi:hypothetical protein